MKLFPWSRKASRRDIEDELEFHLQMRMQEYKAEGLDKKNARLKAHRRFGDVRSVVRECARVAGFKIAEERMSPMMTLIRDLHLALRTFVKKPGYALTAIGVLTVGIGANAAMFSAVNSVIMNPMPFDGGDRFVFLWRTNESQSIRVTAGPEHFQYWGERSSLLEEMAAYGQSSEKLLLDEATMEVQVAMVSSNLLPMLGVNPVIGRTFDAADTLTGGEQVVMLSEGYWKRQFGSRRGIIGESIELEGGRYTVVGVVPELANLFFRGNDKDLWIPSSAVSSPVGRMKPGVTAEQLQQELEQIEAQHGSVDGNLAGWMPVVRVPLDMVSSGLMTGLWVLYGAVGLILLIVCVNVANMSMTNNIARIQDLAVRQALGAGKARLLSAQVVESAAIAVIGSLMGLGLALVIINAVPGALPSDMVVLKTIRLDGPVFLFLSGTAVATTIIASLAPLLQINRIDAARLLNQARQVSETRAQGRFRNVLVGLEVAVAVTLFTASGLLVGTLMKLNSVDTGFEHENLIGGNVVLPAERYTTPEQIAAARDAIASRLEQLPQVSSVGVGSVAPNLGYLSGQVQEVEGNPSFEWAGAGIQFTYASDDYFQTVRNRFISGSGFSDNDPEDVVVINRHFAEQMWGTADAAGKRFRMGPNWSTVVGVVENVPGWGLDDNSGQYQIYLRQHDQQRHASVSLAIRTNVDAAAAIPLLRAQVLDFEPGASLVEFNTVEHEFSESIARQRFNAYVFTAVAGIALLLAVTGVYGVIALSARQRFKELGLRIALGAGRGRVLGLMMRRSMSPVAVGIGVGLLLSFWLSRYLESLLFDVSPTSPAVFGAVGLGMALVALAAGYLPARGATRIDPMIALRAE